jgi:ATP-dependent Lon protease
VKGAPKGSIEAQEFTAFKKCIEELQFMNEQYNKFKKNSKANKNKSEKFMNFYKKCKEKNLDDENKSVSNSEESVNDITTVAKKKNLVKKCQNLLPIELPEGIDSVKSADIEEEKKYLDEEEVKMVKRCLYSSFYKCYNLDEFFFVTYKKKNKINFAVFYFLKFLKMF